MAAYDSAYSGKELDEAITLVFQMKNLGTSKIIENSAGSPVNLKTLIDEEGTYTVYFYTNSYDDTKSGHPINLTVVADSAGNIIQSYDVDGYTVVRKLNITTSQWTDWAQKTPYTKVEQDEELEVGNDTLVFRNITDMDALEASLTSG